VQRDLFRRFLLDGDDREVDEGQVVAGGERAGDAVARGDALVDDRLGQRAGLAPARPRTSASLSAATRPVAASRSATSSAVALTFACGCSGSAGARVSPGVPTVRRTGGCWSSNSLKAIPRTSYRQIGPP